MDFYFFQQLWEFYSKTKRVIFICNDDDDDNVYKKRYRVARMQEPLEIVKNESSLCEF